MKNTLPTLGLVAVLSALGTRARSAAPFGTPENPMVDSTMTREQALEGVRCNPPQKILDRQALVEVRYWGMDDNGNPDRKVHKGQVVIDESVVDDVKALFKIAFETRFAIHKVVPVAVYGWSDAASMADNNTSSWNYRGVGSAQTCPNLETGKGSRHANLKPGSVAIDFNPIQNPYCHDGTCEPAGSKYNPEAPGTLTKEHPLIRLATASRGTTITYQVCTGESFEMCDSKSTVKKSGLGWTWGGNWNSGKDYQHLQR